MSNSEDYSDENIFSNGGGSSGNETDSEGVYVYDKNMKENLILMKIFNPYMSEPEKKYLVLVCPVNQTTATIQQSSFNNLLGVLLKSSC